MLISKGRVSWNSYGTKTLISYQTKKISDLQKYGIVQFVEGCQFMSKLENGEIQHSPKISRPYRGEIIPYFHPILMNDGPTKDPLVWGDASDQSRHFFYLNRPPVPNVKREYFGKKTPPQSRLYVTSRPGGVAAYYPETKTAYNTSLHYRTCLFKTDQVPQSVEPDEVEFATPLHCFDWFSSYIYNFDKRKFETKSEIDPYCFSDPQQ